MKNRFGERSSGNNDRPIALVTVANYKVFEIVLVDMFAISSD